MFLCGFFNFLNIGAGYLLNKASLIAVMSIIESDECFPSHHRSIEDIYMAHCLSHLGIIAMETRDDEDREVFHWFGGCCCCC